MSPRNFHLSHVASSDHHENRARMLSKEEALELVQVALAMHDAQRPTPSVVTVQQASEMLGVTTRTIARMKPPKHGAGKIPYAWVLEQLAVR